MTLERVVLTLKLTDFSLAAYAMLMFLLLPGLFGRSICLMFDMVFKSRKRFIYDTWFIFLSKYSTWSTDLKIVAVILEKGTSYYYLLDIVV